MRCESFTGHSKDYNDGIELVLDFRQNDKSEWTSIRRSNTSSSQFEQDVSANGIVRKIRFLYYDCDIYLCLVDIRVQVQFEHCLRDSEKPTFRCRFLSRNLTVDRSEDVRLQLTGENTIWKKTIFDWNYISNNAFKLSNKMDCITCF